MGLLELLQQKVILTQIRKPNDMKRNSTGGKDGWDPEKYLNIWVCN